MDEILQKAKEVGVNLLGKTSCSIDQIPDTGGVYIIKSGKGVYVGKARNLKRRIILDHMSAELKNTTSTFRRKLNKILGIAPGPKMREWVKDNCQFSFVEIEAPDLRSLVEAFLVTYLRDKENLLNSK